jgi:hypothetical protein
MHVTSVTDRRRSGPYQYLGEILRIVHMSLYRTYQPAGHFHGRVVCVIDLFFFLCKTHRKCVTFRKRLAYLFQEMFYISQDISDKTGRDSGTKYTDTSCPRGGTDTDKNVGDASNRNEYQGISWEISSAGAYSKLYHPSCVKCHSIDPNILSPPLSLHDLFTGKLYLLLKQRLYVFRMIPTKNSYFAK